MERKAFSFTLLRHADQERHPFTGKVGLSVPKGEAGCETQRRTHDVDPEKFHRAIMEVLKCHRAENEPRSSDGVCSAREWSGPGRDLGDLRNATTLLLTTSWQTREMEWRCPLGLPDSDRDAFQISSDTNTMI